MEKSWRQSSDGLASLAPVLLSSQITSFTSLLNFSQTASFRSRWNELFPSVQSNSLERLHVEMIGSLLGVGSAQEADPLMTCVLKTEMFTQMQRVMPGGFNLKIGDAIEYAKKPNKLQHVKVAKDSQQAVDFYKSGAIHTQQGEPPNSVSRPMPKAKPVPPRPITRGKLIKPGGPGGRPSRITGNRNTQPRPGGGPRVVPQPVAVSATPSANQAVETRTLTNNKPLPSHTRNQSSTSEAATRAPPPPPPAAPIAKPKVMAKVLYDFNGQRDNELSIKAGVMLEIVQKENNGMAFRIKIIHETISLIPLTMCRLVAS